MESFLIFFSSLQHIFIRLLQVWKTLYIVHPSAAADAEVCPLSRRGWGQQKTLLQRFAASGGSVASPGAAAQPRLRARRGTGELSSALPEWRVAAVIQL